MSTPFVEHASHEPAERLSGPPVALIDLLDRLLTGGAVLTGDIVLSIADVDLVHIDLRAVIRSVTGDAPAPWAGRPSGAGAPPVGRAQEAGR
ncbi:MULTISPECIES: gas vesicle protein [Streptomyces]|uniref:Gas vesicle synthesis protein n=1 Tax=Streptomyces venezuelae (strain ATCC 10712 / CBS 650.69 / DSM 40230 / JCM 4526 / NBRC 13096 / PD 04745) TaxID=953739 RepID=F2R607_STRVP|nr:gas vesicle protein [Streptomyces venezuelae]QER97265.1 gas vesicle protein [Streptomyces venezuelae ATCC 10712]QES04455.1 gas vesicle protein [Streptomyces venezuelae]CCA53668.1 gas vesicle synthesis protein [Streptomyces venezuelae ATCC 10712]